MSVTSGQGGNRRRQECLGVRDITECHVRFLGPKGLEDSARVVSYVFSVIPILIFVLLAVARRDICPSAVPGGGMMVAWHEVPGKACPAIVLSRASPSPKSSLT